MRYCIYATVFIGSLCLVAPYCDARPVMRPSLDQLLEESELVLVVRPISVRNAHDSERIVPVSHGLEYLFPVFTTFKVVSVLKGDYADVEFELCHYRFKSFTRRPGNGPLLVDFFDPTKSERSETQGEYILFMKRHESGLWTFMTDQYDPEPSVRELLPPTKTDRQKRNW